MCQIVLCYLFFSTGSSNIPARTSSMQCTAFIKMACFVASKLQSRQEACTTCVLAWHIGTAFVLAEYLAQQLNLLMELAAG